MRREGFGGGRGFRGGRDFDQKAAPVKVGEEADVTIEAVGAKGDGIAKKDGFVIFVPNTSTGDNVKIRITKVLSNVAFAEVAGKGKGGEASQASQASQASRQRKESRQEESGKGGEESEGVSEPEERPVDTEDFGEGEEEQ